MFDLFRFVMLRPPEKEEAANPISINAESDLLARLRAEHNSGAPLVEMRRIAEEFMDTDDFVRDASSLHWSQALDSFHNQLQERLSNSAALTLDELTDLVESSFDSSAEELVNDSDLKQDRRRLNDSLVAAKVATWKPELNPVQLSRYIRLIALIELIAAQDAALEEKEAITAALDRVIVLPPDLFPLPTPDSQPVETGGGNGEDEESKRRTELLAKYRHLEEAYKLLTHLELEDISVNVSPLSPSIEEPPQEFTEIERTLRSEVGRLVHVEIDRLNNAELDVAGKLANWRHIQDFVSTERIASADGAITPLRQTESLTVTKLNLKPAAIERFSPELRTTLAGLNINLETTPVPVIAERIKHELTQLTPEVVAAMRHLATPPVALNEVIPVGSQLFQKRDLIDFKNINQPLAGSMPPLPKTHGTAKPVGVADLLVVKQQLIGYETGEVAYIENILKGEAHRREVRRSETTEESTLTEQESLKEEERDLQSTERFELQRESQNVLTLDGRVHGDSFQSPSYGPIVEFENSEQVQLHGVQQLSQRTAETFSKDVTSRAASRVSERVRTQVMRRVVRQFEEKTEHAYDNKEGDKHVVGIYQWVNKIYQAQVYNYGKRMFYDLIVPEPAVFLLQAFARHRAEGRGLAKPDPLTMLQPDGTERPLQPNDITDTNYAYYVAKYQATGVKAPPETYITVSKILTGSSEPTPKDVELLVPDGYELATKWLGITLLETPIPLAVAIARKSHLDLEISKGKSWHALLGCRRKEGFYQQWQLNTYEAILRAYRQKVAEYEERLANVEAALRVGALGHSTEQKRMLERTEVKKGCITLLTHQHFDVFNGIDASYPQINLTNAEPQGRYIRFFEQAIEWEQMMYQFYPYFWGRKTDWIHKMNLEDRDSQFSEFLRAGAARALVPVRPGFEKAVIHFMETGEIWNGGDLPEINSPIYVPLLEELKAQTQIGQTPLPYGNPWKIKLPTTLVMLRPDSKLPKWKQEDGEWVPDE